MDGLCLRCHRYAPVGEFFDGMWTLFPDNGTVLGEEGYCQSCADYLMAAAEERIRGMLERLASAELESGTGVNDPPVEGEM